MPVEIERKFLVTSMSWQEDAEGQVYQQGYIVNQPRATVRVRVMGGQGQITFKGRADGLIRPEFEYEVPLADAGQLLEQFCVKPLIEKTRFLVHFEGHNWEVDVFAGENEGLVIAEIELEHEDETFARPPWLGEEVTDDPRYYNANLVTHPYCRWTE